MLRVSTLLEVARRANVSQSTVSRVLNNSKQGRFSVSPEVRERIVKVATELNYRPSMAARNLAASRTKLVAVLGIRSLQSDRVGPIDRAVAALSMALDAVGYEICMQMYSQRHNPFDLPLLRVDGIVAVGAESLDDLQPLEAAKIPYVSINGVVGRRGTLVSPDDAGGGQLALKHLHELGHRRIAYLDHPAIDAKHPSIFERREAFKSAQKSLGFDVPPAHLESLSGNASWNCIYEPFIQRMILDGGATAVLSYSHFAAISLLRKAHDMGLKVPRDFSVVCYNDEPINALSVPSLTSIVLPSEPIGKVAAELLLSQMAEGSTPKPAHRKLDETLVIRESTAPPKK